MLIVPLEQPSKFIKVIMTRDLSLYTVNKTLLKTLKSLSTRKVYEGKWNESFDAEFHPHPPARFFLSGENDLSTLPDAIWLNISYWTGGERGFSRPYRIKVNQAV